MEAATVVKEPKPRKVLKRKKLTSDPENRVYVLSKEGMVVLDRNGDECTMAGWIEPEVFLDSIQSDKPLESGILSKNLLYFNRKPISDSKIDVSAIYQFDPTIISIKYEKDGVVKNYNLGMPYLQFYCKLSIVNGKNTISPVAYLTCSKAPIADLTSMTYVLPMNNVRADGSICWGYNNTLKFQENTPLFEMGRQAALAFFASTFNDHIPPTIITDLDSPNPNPNRMTFYDVWHAKTIENPLFMTRANLNTCNTAKNILALLR